MSVTHDLLVYALIVLAGYLAWFLTREAVRAVRRLEARDAHDAQLVALLRRG